MLKSGVSDLLNLARDYFLVDLRGAVELAAEFRGAMVGVAGGWAGVAR